MIILEGGNVFKDADGNPQTQRINKQDVQSTVRYLEKLTGLPLLQNMLGSTGIAQSSGDLDLAVDVKSVAKQDLYNQLAQHVQKQGLEVRDYVAKTGDSVHYKTPINGQALNGFVQTDFMFGEPQWQKWALSGAPAGSEFKGKHRAIVLASIARARGMKFSVKNGLLARETDKPISKDPDEIARILVGGTEKDLASVESIVNKLKSDPDYEKLIADARETLAKEGLNLDAMTETNIMRNLRDRIVNQGMSVIVEAARIEHPEDMIFDYGSKGALTALTKLQQLPDQAKDITIKWDGKPAIIFGRDPQGKFVLTDKSGFTAKGYQGMARSPQELEQIMQQRSGERTELVNVYKFLWPKLEAQTPSNMKGYVQGDLLYVGKPKEVSGNYTFTPNTVTYSIDKDSDIGQDIGQSSAGVAIHTYKKDQEDPGVPFSDIDQLGKGDVLFVSPKMTTTVELDLPIKEIRQIEQTVRKNSQKIDAIFNPQTLREYQLANLPALMKQYANFKVREGNFENMAQGFVDFTKTKVSEPKQQRIEQVVAENQQAVTAVFTIFRMIAAIKTRMVRELDREGSGIRATIDGEPGHEGYVASGIKLVDRLRFSRSNFAKNLQ
jgi:hypothetical protein